MRRTTSLLGARLTVVFVMFSVGSLGSLVRAADPPPNEASSTPAQRAKQHYQQGEAYFKAKNFSAAMEEYQRGYLEKANPVFIFNIAQCQRLLGNSAAAVEFYQRYLQEAPDGPGRPVAEKQIAELSGPAKSDAPPAPEAGAAPVVPLPAAAPTPVIGQAAAGQAAAGQAAAAQAAAAQPAAAQPAAAQPAGAEPAAPQPAAPVIAATPSAPPAEPPVAESAATPPPLPTAPPPATTGGPVYVTAQRQPDEKPIYRTWYFWTAVAALVVSTVVVAAATSSNRPNCDAGRICK